MQKRILSAAVCAALAGPVLADPPPANNKNLPQVFCFRITDIERPVDAYVNGLGFGALLPEEDDRFLFEFEVLNWSNQTAEGLQMSLNTGSSNGVVISNAFIDEDGRGGSIGTAAAPEYGEIDIDGGGTSDATPHQGGRGNSKFKNDWDLLIPHTSPSSSVFYAAKVEFENTFNNDGDLIESNLQVNGTPIPFQNLLNDPAARVPGLGVDSEGDTAIDGGQADPYVQVAGDSNPLVEGALPTEIDGTGNVLDGFVIEIDGLGIGDKVSFNWFLMDAQSSRPQEPESVSSPAFAGGEGPAPDCVIDPTLCFNPIGTSSGGNNFGFGTFSLARMAIGGALPGPLFGPNVGFNQNPITFFCTEPTVNGVCPDGKGVFDLPNAAEVSGELGGGITAPFHNPDDNIFNVNANVPEPASLALLGLGLTSLVGIRRRRMR